MALCLAESLIERRGFDPVDQLKNTAAGWTWTRARPAVLRHQGTTKSALRKFQETGEKNPLCGLTGRARPATALSCAWHRSPWRSRPCPGAVKKSG